MEKRTLWSRAYRLALRALPATLRDKYGQEIEALFARELEQARREGSLKRAVVGIAGIWDVVHRGLYERWRNRPWKRSHEHGGYQSSPSSFVSTLIQDTAYALRSLLKAPGFTATAILTMALGVGANTAIFSAVDAILLRPLPFPDAKRVVNLAWEGNGHIQTYLSGSKFQYWRDHARSFQAMATWRSHRGQIGDGAEASSVHSLRVSRDFLDVLGYRPALGRDFTLAEDVPDGPRVALVSRRLWRTRFGDYGNVGGRTLRLDEELYAVIGVLPESFAFPYETEPVEVIVPLGLTADPADVAENWPTIARLENGVDRAAALSDVESLTSAFREEHPNQVDEGVRGMTLATFTELYVRDGAQPLWILMGAVTLVLLIACANVANLFLARAERRRGEIALRAALGATRGRIARLVLTESLLVALVAAALSLPLAIWGLDKLTTLTPVQLPRMATIGIDWRVLSFTFSAAVVTGLLFGAVAARPAMHPRLTGVLKESARGHSHRARSRQLLVVAQSALSMVLLVGAGLLVVTLISLQDVEPGFESEGLVAVRLPVKPSGYETSSQLWELERRVAAQVMGSSTVASVAGASSLPLERGVNVPVTIDDAFFGSIEWRAVTPGYFQTLGIALVSGRRFEDADGEDAPPVAIVNQALARRYFPDQNPIGGRIEVGRVPGRSVDPSISSTVEIVGVVTDIREMSLRNEPRRTMYVPQAQASDRLSTLLGTMPVFIARGHAAGQGIERALAEALSVADPQLPRPQVFSFGDVIAASLTRERFGATLLTVLAALALVLTASGIYAVLAYRVRQRRREIGIRMALGADRLRVAFMVVAQGMAPVAVGLLLGVVGAVALSRVVGAYVWGITPTDPGTFAVVGTILFSVALLASWFPAREAVDLDPVETLNSE